MADAMPSRAELHRVLDELPDEDVPAAFAALTRVQQDALRSALAGIPGLHLPAQWPPQFADFQPMSCEGEPLSDQLIRERR